MTNTEQARKNLYRWAKGRARRRGLVFELTLEDLAIPALCPVLGIPLVLSVGRPGDYSPSLDRIDPLQGYTRDNTMVVSYRANRLKSDAQLYELQRIALFYSKLHDAGQTYSHMTTPEDET